MVGRSRVAEVHGQRFYNEDCIAGAPRRLAPGSVDLIITDPPYGIAGDTLHKHYNRREEFVTDGYVEVPAGEYADFSRRWVAEAARALRPGGSIYVVSGYTHLLEVLAALRAAELEEVNHLIWKFNFGVFTRTKYISSHYHVLYYTKPGGPRTFNTQARFGLLERSGAEGSLNYADREDVWDVKREYKPGQRKNKNELPAELLAKMVQYSSNTGDLVADFFLGGFSTARVALGLGRRSTGFELSQQAFEHGVASLRKVEPGELLIHLRVPDTRRLPRQGAAWTEAERARLRQRFAVLRAGSTKKATIAALTEEFGRGRWAIEKELKRGPGGAAAPSPARARSAARSR